MGCSLAREMSETECACECACRYVCVRVRKQWKGESHREIEKQRNLENTYGVGE